MKVRTSVSFVNPLTDLLSSATSAIDYKTDTIIQKSLRNELGGATLLTIAHRLQTIMDFDRIVSMFRVVMPVQLTFR